MKRIFHILCAVTLVSMIIGACTLGETPPPATPAPATESPEVEPALTGLPVVDAPPSDLISVNLAGPPMEVGSTYLYIDGSTLVAVPESSFIYGKKNGSDNPEITLTLSDYWIYRTEVTNQQYERCVGANKCTSPNLEDNPSYLDPARKNDPVTGVDWFQADTYCGWVNGFLPSEPQWEKAARGPDGNIFPWGEGAPTCSLLNFNSCVGSTTEVTKYPQGKSYYDALDMAGNSYEWTADRYDPFYYRNAPLEDPPGPDLGDTRSVRSGGYKSNKDQVPTWVRFFDRPEAHRRDLGFRCVVFDPTFFAPFCEQIPNYVWGGGSGSPNPGTDYVCPNVEVSSEEQHCDSYSTYVKFTTTIPGQTNDPDPGCGAAIVGDPGYPQMYDCHAPGSAEIKGWCTLSGGSATCDTNYILDETTGICEWDTSVPVGTACPEGYVYDQVNHCCTASPGSIASYPLCQPPYTMVESPPGTFQCATGLPPQPHDSESWNIPGACTGGEEPCNPENPGPAYPNGCPDDDGCTDPPTCTYPYILRGCSCVCSPQATYCG